MVAIKIIKKNIDIYIFILHNNDVTQKKFQFRVLVMCYLHMAVVHLPPNFAQIALSNSELLTFSEIQDGGRHHLGFSSRVHL